MKKVLLLATNTNDAKILLWCLREAGYLCVVAGNLSTNNDLRYSFMCEKFYAIPESLTIGERSNGIVSFLKDIVVREKIEILLPTGFESVKFLSQYQDNLSDFVRIISVPEANLIDTLHDKFKFSCFCSDHTIPHAESCRIDTVDEVRDDRYPLCFPLLVKPLNLSGGKGIYKFDNRKTLLNYLISEREDKYNVLPLLLQTFIPGIDIEFSAFATNGKLNSWTIQEFLSISMGREKSLKWYQFVKNNEVFEMGKKIVQIANYSGPINIAFRIDSRDMSLKAIEVNPRFWASTFYSIIDGVNFPDVAIKSMFEPKYIKKPNYSGHIWGSPHHLLLLILRHRNMLLVRYAFQHTLLQVKYMVFNGLEKNVISWRKFSNENNGMKKICNLMSKAKKHRQRYGIIRTSVRAFLKIIPFIRYYETILFVREVGEDRFDLETDLNLDIAEISEQDFKKIEQLKGISKRNFIQERLKNNEKCFIAKDHNEICCYAWVACGERIITHEKKQINIGPEEAYIHDCLTVSNCRGKGVFPFLLNYICHLLETKGYKRMVSIVYEDNYASIKAFEKVGFLENKIMEHVEYFLVMAKFNESHDYQ